MTDGFRVAGMLFLAGASMSLVPGRTAVRDVNAESYTNGLRQVSAEVQRELAHQGV